MDILGALARQWLLRMSAKDAADFVRAAPEPVLIGAISGMPDAAPRFLWSLAMTLAPYRRGSGFSAFGL